MLFSIVRLLRFASVIICAIVITSFAIFALEQAQSASKQQAEELAGPASPTGVRPGAYASTVASAGHESSLHEAIDAASRRLTSPFAGVIPSSSSEWVIRGVKLALALVLYGFGLGYLTRALRIRA